MPRFLTAAAEAALDQLGRVMAGWPGAAAFIPKERSADDPADVAEVSGRDPNQYDLAVRRLMREGIM